MSGRNKSNSYLPNLSSPPHPLGTFLLLKIGCFFSRRFQVFQVWLHQFGAHITLFVAPSSWNKHGESCQAIVRLIWMWCLGLIVTLLSFLSPLAVFFRVFFYLWCLCIFHGFLPVFPAWFLYIFFPLHTCLASVSLAVFLLCYSSSFPALSFPPPAPHTLVSFVFNSNL